jgi:hypothetical protein
VAHGSEHKLSEADTRRLGSIAWPAYRTAVIIGAAGLLLAALVALLLDQGMMRFAHAYTASFAFVLSIVLGGLFFVLATHLFKGGWCVVVRRPMEVLGASVPVMAILFAPILVFVLANNGTLYEWAQPYTAMGSHGGAQSETHETKQAGSTHTQANVQLAVDQPGHGEAGSGHGDEAKGAHAGQGEHAGGHGVAHYVKKKQPYLSRGFFVIRWIIYFGVWSGLGLWFWRQSTRQDGDGDARRTFRLEKLSAPGMVLFGLTLTFASFDLVMSLDPLWYSTIFGVYYFAGCVLGSVATLVLSILGLQRLGFFQSVNVEHFHDLGKLLFAFTFFWGYIAFSQYMLYWYGNVPAEIEWFQVHGFTTVAADITGWSYLGIVLLVGHLLIPFAGLLSYHAKRNVKVLAFWAVWLLVMHWLDVIWLVMPELTVRTGVFNAGDVLLLVATLVGVAGIAAGTVIRIASQHSLMSMGDPRLSESLAFENH